MTLPDGWHIKPLAEVAQVVMGQSPDSKYYSEEEVGLPFLQGCAEFQGRHPMHTIYCSHSKKIGCAGSILLSVRAPVGRLNVANRDYVIGRGLAALKGTRVTQDFLEHFLVFQEPRFRLASQGSTFEAINSSELKQWPVLHPKEKAEQAKISEVLSTMDRAIEETEALIVKQQRIKTGLVQDLLTRGIDEHGNLRSEQTHKFKDSPLGRIPMEWESASLAVFVPSAEYGISTSLGESGYPVLRMNNLLDGEAELSDLKFTDGPVPKHLWLRDGDVLFNRTNSWEHVGRTGIWRGQIESTTFASYLVRLNPHPDKLLPEMLNFWLNWERIQIAMRRQATPAVQQVNINPTNLRSIPAAFPRNLDEQTAIAVRISAVREILNAYREHLYKLRSIKVGLMQDLLTGDRRVTALLEQGEGGTA